MGIVTGCPLQDPAKKKKQTITQKPPLAKSRDASSKRHYSTSSSNKKGMLIKSLFSSTLQNIAPTANIPRRSSIDIVYIHHKNTIGQISFPPHILSLSTFAVTETSTRDTQASPSQPGFYGPNKVTFPACSHAQSRGGKKTPKMGRESSVQDISCMEAVQRDQDRDPPRVGERCTPQS